MLVLASAVSIHSSAAESTPDSAAVVTRQWTTVPAESEAYRIGRSRLLEFAETPQFLDERQPVMTDFIRECNHLNRRCVDYLRSNRAAARAALPDNPEYFSRYAGVLAETPLMRTAAEVETDAMGAIGKLMEAARYWPMHALAADGLDMQTLHFHVLAHRRLLAQSNFLIDKMIFIATTGLSVLAINAAMARVDVAALDPEQKTLLDEMLESLTTEELSLRRPLRGEYQYALLRATDTSELNDAVVDELLTVYTYMAERSEQSWPDYWQHGVDVWADVPLQASVNTVPPELWVSWVEYTNNIRYVDLQIHMLRALREVYAGRASPGIPGLAPPPRWHWQWRSESRELCLEPGDIHPSVSRAQTICMELLDG